MSEIAQQNSSKPRISVVVPVFNEVSVLPQLFDGLRASQIDEIVVVDGGSNDGSWPWLQEMATVSESSKPFVQIAQSELGRAKQMNHGAGLSRGEIIIFLHADTRLPTGAQRTLIQSAKDGRLWGRFDVSFPAEIPNKFAMSVIAFFINLRSRVSGVATGDQAIFVNAEIFCELAGFAELPLMEDIDLCRRLKKVSRPYCSKLKVVTSHRRWQDRGIVKTVLLMWVYRLAFFVGVPADYLAKQYRNVR